MKGDLEGLRITGPLLRFKRFVHFLAVELRDKSEDEVCAVLEDENDSSFERAINAELEMSLADGAGSRHVDFPSSPLDDDPNVVRLERFLVDEYSSDPEGMFELLAFFSDRLGGEDVREPLSPDERRRARNKRKALERRARGG